MIRTKKFKLAVIIFILMVCGICFTGCDTECCEARSHSTEVVSSSPSSTVPGGGNTTDPDNQAGDNTADIVYNIIYHNTKGINNLTQLTFKASDTIVLQDLTVDGWTFGGWSDSSTDINVITGWSAGDHTSDVTLWAVWTPKTYTVALQHDSDVSGDASVTATFDANLPSLTIVPSKIGYNFGGYWTLADGQGTQYIDASGDGCKKWNLTSDATLIAFFMEHGTHQITYNNLKDATLPSKRTFKESETIVLEAINVDGYTFDGWFDAAEGGSKVEGWAAGAKTDNVIVYAHWTAEQYDITYKDENDAAFSGTMTSAPTKHTYGTPTALPVPTKTGYEFGGWFTSSGCSDSSIDMLGVTSFTADITLYAKWNIITYSITYLDRMNVDNTNRTEYTVLDDVVLSDLSALGLIFYGWSEVVDDVTADTTTNGWNAGYIGNVTLWARWNSGYQCSAAQMAELLESFNAEDGPFQIRITDLAPDMSLIKTALQTYSDVSVDLDLSRCSSLTEIPENGLSYCHNLVGISFSENVISFGDNAFYNSSNISKVDYRGTIEDWCGITFSNSYSNPTYYAHSLYLNGEIVTDLIIPDTVTEIKKYAFTQCSNITTVQMPNSVTSIGSGAFSNCIGLTEPVYNAHIFVKMPISHSGSYTIPSGITSIADSAFNGCSGMTNIEIPNSVMSIGNSAFSRCKELISIDIPNSVTSIGENVFYNCDSLTSVTIPDSVTNIGKRLFYHCNKLTSVTIGSGLTSIEERCFEDCHSLANITIPDGVTSIGDKTFYNCYALMSVTIPDSVESIGSQAFWLCSSLTTLTVKATIPPMLGNTIFYYCSALTTIYVPTGSVEAYKVADGWSDYADKIAAIGSGFPNMVSVSELSSYISTISDDETSEVIITDNTPDLSAIKTILQAYPQKNILLNLKLCLGLTEIQAGVLDDCSCLVEMSYPSSLTSVVVPNTINRIAEYAFFGNGNLISIEIPNSVTSIGDFIFWNCSCLTSVTIGNGVTSIGNYAFSTCGGMTTLTVNASTPPIFGDNMLFGCNALTTIYVPTGSVETYKATSGWSDYADKIVAISTEP